MSERNQGSTADLTVRILRDIRDEIKALRKDTNARFDALETTMETGFHVLTKRIDAVVENTGSHWRDHEARLARLEKRVGMPKLVK